jgi:hypothetical protein
MIGVYANHSAISATSHSNKSNHALKTYAS